jgi:hypothetical protein
MSIDTLCNVMLFKGRWIGMRRIEPSIENHDVQGRYKAEFLNPYEWVAPLHNGQQIRDGAGMTIYERIPTEYRWNGR